MGTVVKLKQNKVDTLQFKARNLLLSRVQRAIAGKDLTDDELVEIITNELEELLVPMPKVA